MFCLFVRANPHQSDRPGLPDPHFLLEKPKKTSGYHEVQSHIWPPGIGEGSQYTPCEGQHFFLVPGSGNKGRSCVDGSGGPGTLHPYHPHLRVLSREEPDVTAKRHKNCWGGGRPPFHLETTLSQSIPKPPLRSANTPIPAQPRLTNHGSSSGKRQA